jgi:small-conductance mechanosensitive channel
MDELIRQLNGLLKHRVITLDDEVKVWQIVVFVAILVVSLIVAGYIRRWFRRIFDRLKIQQNNANRLLAILFLIVMVVGIVVAFNVAQISTGLFGKVINYPLSDLFQSSGKQTDADSGETDSGEKPLPETVDEAQSGLTLAKLFYGFVIVFGMFVLSKYAQLGLQRQVLQAFQIQRHAQFIILRFFHYILITIGVLISLNTLGMSFTNLAIIFGGLSIGIGFGLQNTVANLIAGFVLIFERPIKIGDLIEIMDVNIFGRVSSINLRSTIIMALDEKEIIVPNSQLVMEPVHNLTHYNNRYRIHVQVGVSYSSDVELVKKALLEVAQEHPEVIKEPTRNMENVTAPFVRFTNFGDSSLDFELLAWIPDSFKRFDIASDLHFMVWQKFKEHNIKIPFPQRDVHFYSEERQ